MIRKHRIAERISKSRKDVMTVRLHSSVVVADYLMEHGNSERGEKKDSRSGNAKKERDRPPPKTAITIFDYPRALGRRLSHETVKSIQLEVGSALYGISLEPDPAGLLKCSLA